MTVKPPAGGTPRAWVIAAAAFFAYLVVAIPYTRPLLSLGASRIAGDPGDPILNTSILWWNATTVPFTAHWWSPPYYYLTHGVTAFTENLLGLSVVASPIYWLTGNPLTTYNVTLFLTWPLSAFAAFLLVWFLTRRVGGAWLAGVAYGFTPYRLSELGHIQMLASFWMPLALLGLHGYLERRRARWLVLFGAAWLLQSLANGYLMLFGAVLIGLWILYFCSTRETWRAVPAIVGAWAAASLPLAPVMWTYRQIHEYYGLRRALSNPLGFSVPLRAWLHVSHVGWLWPRLLPEGSDNHFPGVTALALVAAALAAAIVRWLRPDPAGEDWRAAVRRGLAAAAVIGGAVALYTSVAGRWSVSAWGMTLRVSDSHRALAVAAVSGVAWIGFFPSARRMFGRRSSFFFYGAATLAMAVCAVGPALQIGRRVQVMPYRWLMLIPGFTELRVPMRFWMLGVLCLAVSAGLAFETLSRRRPLRTAIFVAALAGLLLDGWVSGIPMAAAPVPWPVAERPAPSSGPAQPILELPLGPPWDAAATYRSIWTRRPMVNGVSGYDPPDYAPLQDGLNAHDPGILTALASFGSFDIVVNGADDPDGAWARYAASAPGAVPVASDGTRTTYRVPAIRFQEAEGGALQVASVRASLDTDAQAMIDGRLDTEWRVIPQQPGQWVLADLGAAHAVGGVTLALGEEARDFPRHLVIETSLDQADWSAAWEGQTAGPAFRASATGPREARMVFTFDPRDARFVRLRQTADAPNFWRIAELQVLAPAGAAR